MKTFLFELCAQSLEAAEAAERGGAGRIELCTSLSAGGVTPPYDLMVDTIKAISIPVHVLIRPRAGDFVYSPEEFDIIRRQIAQAKFAGAAGVAVGVLLPGGRVDIDRTRSLVNLARPMEATFHRAFDETPDLAEALEDVIQTGADSLLTSGGAANVLAGADTIAALARQAEDRIQIIAGGGLRLTSILEVARRSGIFCLHGSLVRDKVGHAAGPLALEQDLREAVRLLHDEFVDCSQRALAN